MTKEQLIDLIIDRLAGGDCPQELKGKYHPEIVSKHIGIAMNYLMQNIVYKEAERYGMSVFDSYTKTYKNVEVLFDEDRNEKYSILPCSVIVLPDNRGVRMISAMHDQKNSFVYRSNNSLNIYGQLDVDLISKRARFYIESKSVFYDRHLSADITQVLMKLIPEFDSLDDDDEVGIPTAYGKLIFDLVIQSMLGKPLEKMSNDNNSNVI